MKFVQYVSDNRYKIYKTLLTYVAFAGVGGAATLLGSSLLDIQIRVQRSFKVTSNLVPTRAIGYIIGAISSGFFEQNTDHTLLLSLSGFLAGISLIAAPWFYQFILVSAFMFISGFGQGLIDIYCNIYIVKIWGKDCTNWLQVLHMFFGLGSLLTPIFTRPFLLPLSRDEDGIGGDQANVTIIYDYSPGDVIIQYSYLILGGILVFPSIPFLFCYLKDRNSKAIVQEDKASNDGESVSRFKIYIAVVMMAIVANLSFGSENLTGTLGPAFSVKSDLKMSKRTGVLLTTVYWSTFSFYRLIFIPLTMIFKEERLVLFNIFILLISIVVMVPHASHNSTYTWISFTLLGIGCSPLYANAYGSLVKYFDVTGKMASFILIIGTLGESVHPSIVAQFMEETPQVFIYYLGTMAFLYALMCIILPIYCKKMLTGNQVKIEMEPNDSSSRRY